MSRVPTVLFVNAFDGEDFGVQYAYDGLCDLLGWRHVVDWPRNPYCHKSPFQQREYDADLSWPTHFFHEHEIRDLLVSRQFDLTIVSSTRMTAMGTVNQLQHWIPHSGPVVLLDMEDSEEINVAPLDAYSGVRDAAAVIFKREWKPKNYGSPVPVLPLPFSYPRSRFVGDVKPGGSLVFYRANDWGWKEDSPRHRMVQALKERFGDQADVGLSSCTDKVWTNRLSNAEYHHRLWASKIGIAVNECGGSDNNRYWETVAHGCVLVSDRPRHEIPNNFEHGTEAFFYSSIEEAVEIVDMLSKDDALRQRVAMAGVQKFLRCHTTAARALYMLEQIAAQLVASGKKPGWVG